MVKRAGYNAGKATLTVHTWLHYDNCFLCMKAVKNSTLNTSRCAEKAFKSIQGFPIGNPKSIAIGACNCLPYLWKSLQCVVPVYLAIIAGHDPGMLYIDNLLCACDDIAISASCSSFNSCMITLSPYSVSIISCYIVSYLYPNYCIISK